ncbi:pseudouridine synthase [Elysia marginata]|uniref:Pseudouridine synthase n=1 Tax=Elysia marginata TaxID=1093978 RepID=A0AAV4JHD4_9GAST|nr:pseudouridine synthase [Elysia marginata]
MSSAKPKLCNLLHLSFSTSLFTNISKKLESGNLHFSLLVRKYWLALNRFSFAAKSKGPPQILIPSSAEQQFNFNSFTPMDVCKPKIIDGTLSKRAQKRLARYQKHKEQLKQKRAEEKKLTQKDDAGYSLDDFHESDYYFENGLRKVYPYTFTFATHAKGRWVGRTIKDVLEKEFGFDQPDDLLNSFNAGKIHVNSQEVGPDYTVRDCDLISHKIHRHENPVTWDAIEIIKNTEDLVVINKPSSIPCHPCGRYRFNSIVFILGKEMGYTNLRNIYRLDRLTSGVLMLAKTTKATKMLEDQVANRQVQKEYVCRVAGKFPEGPVTVDQPLRALSNKLRLQIVCPTGKASRTEFELVSFNGRSSVVKCRPFTGRTHQIRVHLQYLGNPIINDAFYNNTAWGPGNGKGGNYEVPFEDVCAKILKEHHANLWDGGENPLYFKKVKEMEERAAASDSQQVEGLLDATTNVGNSLVCGGTDALTSEPPSKKLKEDKEDDVEELFNSNGYPASSKSHHSDPTCVDVSSDSNKVKASATDFPDNTVATGANKKNDPAEDQILAHLGLNNRPGFEMSKWSVDTSCDLCKRLPIEPRERDMVMFLHALKYKGPGWEYETSLPDWARSDWNLEDDFVDVESANCR